MGKQGRRVGTLKKSGIAYALPPSAADVVHPVDMSGLQIEPCDGCDAPVMTLDEMMTDKQFTGGIVCKYWMPASKTCQICMAKSPYATLTLAELVGATVPRETITLAKVHQILARCEMSSALRLHETVHRVGLCNANVEMANRMIASVKAAYKNVPVAKRPPELIARIDDALLKLDMDTKIHTRAILAIECVNGTARYGLTCMVIGTARK